MMDSSLAQRLRPRLNRLYGDRSGACLEQVGRLVDRFAPFVPSRTKRLWDQRDVVLITYGDHVQARGQKPLPVLRRFLTDFGLDKLINTVHLLPFFPYSSDDGFSVIDYRNVDPALGNWQDVRELGQEFDLMFDLVLNHVSQRGQWFQAYLAGTEPYVRYFIEADPRADLSAVIRPRSLPLLTPLETSRGVRHLWTTFGPDQIDLNFAEPDVLVEMTDVLLSYVLHGARVIRLDAVAYLSKEIGTSCIHLPRTHEVVKFLRDLLDAVAPGTLLLTETNVPHAENISYFGDGDEAHMVYQFSLPPLLLDAFVNQDAEPLMRWLAALEPARRGTTFFNFTASHDGIGVRPLEGLVSESRLAHLVQAVKARGGMVSTRRNPDGGDTPYELNITYAEALGEPAGMAVELHARRFLASQALMLAMRGVPGVYFSSLVGAPNDFAGVEASGQARRINRRKFDYDELVGALSNPASMPARVLKGYRQMLAVRIRQPAFHPDAQQTALPVEQPCLVAWLRTSVDGGQRVLVLANLSDRQEGLDLAHGTGLRWTRDLLTDRPLGGAADFLLGPYQVAWLESAS